MKYHYSSLLMALAVGLFSFHPAVFAASAADDPAQGVDLQVATGEEIRTGLLNTLDNAEGTAAGIGMSTILADQISKARESILSATSGELEAIPVNLHASIAILEVSTGQMRLMYDPALQKSSSGKDKSRIEQSGQGVTIQSTGVDYDKEALDEPVYPEDAWDFAFKKEKPDRKDEDGGPGDVGPDEGSGDGGGACRFPGTAYRSAIADFPDDLGGRVVILNAQIAATAINMIAHEFCELALFGFNVSPLCIATDIVEIVAVGIDSNQALCNEHIGAAEVSATWEGIKTVHGNVQHVHDDVADVDSALSLHNTTVRNDINEHDSDVKTQLTAHDTNIDGDLATHDTNIDGDLIQHDSDMKTQLATHDADIKARLGEIQSTVNENQRLIKISMSRQLEMLRLQITPEGRREINPDVLSCTGDDCPLESEVLSCANGVSWPCK